MNIIVMQCVNPYVKYSKNDANDAEVVIKSNGPKHAGPAHHVIFQCQSTQLQNMQPMHSSRH